jgi:peroxiredoxin Q/BCP
MLTFAAVAFTATSLSAQTPPPPQAPQTYGPGVGEMAADFTAPGADRSGPLKAPIKLSDFRGKTVVLAFFPAARTSGCTMQMNQYRDQFEKLFAGGKDVVLLGISTDADTTLANWAKEANFPFQFVSDASREIGTKYGTLDERAQRERRYVYVIGPDGKIAYVKKPFSPAAAPHYEELGAAVASAGHQHD